MSLTVNGKRALYPQQAFDQLNFAGAIQFANDLKSSQVADLRPLEDQKNDWNDRRHKLYWCGLLCCRWFCDCKARRR